MESTGASFVARTHSTPLEYMIQPDSKVDDVPGLITLLKDILVFDPLQRPSASDLLKHPWFVGSSDVTMLSGPVPEAYSSSSEDESDSSSSEVLELS